MRTENRISLAGGVVLSIVLALPVPAETVAFRTLCGFSDVKADDYYENPVLWAVEKELTTGKTVTRFAPNDDCTRGQIVTFMWRLAAK